MQPLDTVFWSCMALWHRETKRELRGFVTETKHNPMILVHDLLDFIDDSNDLVGALYRQYGAHPKTRRDDIHLRDMARDLVANIQDAQAKVDAHNESIDDLADLGWHVPYNNNFFDDSYVHIEELDLDAMIRPLADAFCETTLRMARGGLRCQATKLHGGLAPVRWTYAQREARAKRARERDEADKETARKRAECQRLRARLAELEA